MLKTKISKIFSATIFFVVFLVASQQVFADKSYEGLCYPLFGHYLYLIVCDEGYVVYAEIQWQDGTTTPIGGEKPPGWIIKPNGDVVDVWEEVDRLRSTNSALTMSEALSTVVPVEKSDDTTVTLRSECIDRYGIHDFVNVKVKEKFYFNFSNTFAYDPTPFIAKVEITETPQSISINTNKEVFIRMVNVSTGAELLYTSTDGIIDIPISHLSVGCRYSIIIQQNIDDKMHQIRTHNFCKDPNQN